MKSCLCLQDVVLYIPIPSVRSHAQARNVKTVHKSHKPYLIQPAWVCGINDPQNALMPQTSREDLYFRKPSALEPEPSPFLLRTPQTRTLSNMPTRHYCSCAIPDMGIPPMLLPISFQSAHSTLTHPDHSNSRPQTLLGDKQYTSH